ncbi:MAG: hypothetical protein AVDCRST_MAG37-2775, partial [uncultured Rubrobacteraceae bacterium]
WGEEDEFRPVSFARRFEQEIASSRCPARATSRRRMIRNEPIACWPTSSPVTPH